MLCRADSVGVFQVESRAQMATLPRLRAPRRSTTWWWRWPSSAPGPSRAARCTPTSGAATARSRSPTCTRCWSSRWRKTLGVPLFQEQLMQMAIDVAGFTPAEADELRQAMGSKRSRERMERLRERFYDGHGRAGHHRRGGRRDLREAGRLRQLRLPREPLGELRLPGLRLVLVQALLPGRVLRRAAQRPAHGLLLAPHPGAGRPPPRRRGPHPRPQRQRRRRHPRAAGSTGGAPGPGRRRRRLGAGRAGGAAGDRRRCAGSATDLAEAIAAGRPYADLEDLARRAPALTLPQLEALATAGAFGCFGLDRREALWAAGAVAQGGAGPPGRAGHRGRRRPTLPGHEPPGGGRGRPVGHRRRPRRPPHPLRPRATSTGSGRGHRRRAGDVDRRATGCWSAAWSPTASARPPPAGITFINLEDETGLINVVVLQGLLGPLPHRWPAARRPCSCGAGWSRSEGVINVVADKLEPLPVAATGASRDFR